MGPLVAQLCWAAAYVGAGYLGRASIIDGRAMSLVWPAAGVAVCWLLASRGSRRPVAVALLVIATFAVNRTTGASAALATVFVVANLIQGVGTVWLLERALPGIAGIAGPAGHRLARLGDLARIARIAAVACLGAVTWGMLGLHWAGLDATPVGFATWFGRNLVGLLVVLVVALLLRPDSDAPRATWTRLRVAELGALVGATLGVWYVVFVAIPDLLFLLLLPTVWAGIRFAAPWVVVHGTAAGVAGVALTIVGLGPLAGVDDLALRALYAQVFVAMTALTGLALAFSRSERDAVIERLAYAEREASDRAAELAAVLETVGEGLVVVEADGRLHLQNPAARRLLGLEGSAHVVPDRVRPSSTYRVLDADGRPVAYADLPVRAARDGETLPARDYRIESDAVPADRVLSIGATPMPPGPGGRGRSLLHIRDVTLDRQQREALSSFAGVVAHDLLNPLTLVQGWAESLAFEFDDGPVDPATGISMLERIQVGAGRMRAIIDDLLAYAVARDAQVLPRSTDVTALVEAIARLRENGPRAAVVTVEPGLVAWADEGLVRQLLDNLVANAIKYTAPEVRPRVHVSGTTSRAGWIELRVTDNGVGVPAEDRERIFTAFERVAGSPARGTGLGLAICRQVVERHHGTIHAEAGPDGVGTTIVVRLPRTPRAFDAAADRQAVGAGSPA